MRHSSAVTVAVLTGIVAVIAPIWISVRLSWREALADESSVALNYGREVLRRTDETALQMWRGINLINGAHNPPCSPQELVLMKKVDIDSSYIKAVGRLSGNEIVCTSLTSQDPISLGPPTLITANGAEERLNISLPVADHPVEIFSLRGVAFVLDPTLMLDVPTEGPDISIAIFVPSSAHHTIFASRGVAPHPDWFRTIPKGSSLIFRDAGYIVTIVRSPHTDVAIMTSAPESYAVKRVSHFALFFIPLGLFCAGVLVWAVAYASRIQLSLPSVLRGAAKRKEFFVEYQPIVELATGRWVGAEALVRWQRNGRIVRPDNFIPIAEESGVITQITACVAEMVAADLPALLKINPDFFVAINLSAPDLRSIQTVELLKSMLRQNGIQPANIKIEATERGFSQGAEARNVLASIRALGVEVAIDDFGTGYSSLSCLQTLDLDALKIDKAFVDTVGTDGATSHVVSHIIRMAHSLNLMMIAEGVEAAVQAHFLREGGVQFAQGWLFAKAMSLRSLCAECKSHGRSPDER